MLTVQELPIIITPLGNGLPVSMLLRAMCRHIHCPSAINTSHSQHRGRLSQLIHFSNRDQGRGVAV